MLSPSANKVASHFKETVYSFFFCFVKVPKSDPKDDSGDASEMEKDPESKLVTIIVNVLHGKCFGTCPMKHQIIVLQIP